MTPDPFYHGIDEPSDREYPAWVCATCGRRFGRRVSDTHLNNGATWHQDACGICGKQTAVTEPRDFGHLKDGWQNHQPVERPCENCGEESVRATEDGVRLCQICWDEAFEGEQE